MKLHLHQGLLEDAIRASSDFFKIAPVYIEKDYWLCKILQQLSRSRFTESTVFKGGTSLSKGYGLINRFSEDIDIAVITGNLTGNQVKTLISNVCKAITQGLHEIDVPELTSKGSRFRKVIYKYPSTIDTSMYQAVTSRVIVEVNSFANPYPFEKRVIKSFITEYLEEKGMQSFITEYDMYPFTLNVLDKYRTLCEKVVSLLRFSCTKNPLDGIGEKIRHFYDIYFLLDDNECIACLQDNFIHDINKLIEHDKETFNFPEGWREIPMNEIPLLNSYNELWNKLKETYRRELGALAYSPIPSSDEIYEKIMPFIIRLKNHEQTSV